MNRYTIVVCPDCKYVFQVLNRPTTTTCGKCQKRHQFKKLKKYHKTDDKHEARYIVGAVQAKVFERTTDFQEAAERGLLDDVVDSVISDVQYLERMGLDPDEVEEQVEQQLHTQDNPAPEGFEDDFLSAKGLNRESLESQVSEKMEAPEYRESPGIDDEDYLGAYGIDNSEVEEKANEKMEAPKSKNKKEQFEEVFTLDSPTISDAADYLVTEYSFDQSAAEDLINKMIERGEVSVTTAGVLRRL